MARKSGHILENPLPSEIYYTILVNYKKTNLSGYKIATLIYGRNKFFIPQKVYLNLRYLKKLNLIFEEEKAINNRKIKIIKPNLIEFVKVLNERRIPPEHRLTEEEIKILADFLDNIDWSIFEEFKNIFLTKEQKYFIEEIKHSLIYKLNILDLTAFILKISIFLKNTLCKKFKIDKQGEEILFQIFRILNTPSIHKFYEFLLNKDLPEPISKKLENLVILNENVTFLYDIVILFFNSISQIYESSENLEKK